MSNAILETLAKQLLEAKKAETQAKEARVALEEQIIEILGKKEEGTISVKTENYTVKTVGKLTRSVDSEALLEVVDTLPEEVQELFTWKASLSLTAYRKADEKFTKLADTYIEVKEAKPSVEVKAN